MPSVDPQSASVRITSAIPCGLALSVPLKMTSSIFAPLSALALCSPRTQRTASDTLLFPHPLGPTIAVIPGLNSSFVFCAKLLNPINSIDLRYNKLPPAKNRH